MYKTKFSLPTNKMFVLLLIHVVLRKTSVNNFFSAIHRIIYLSFAYILPKVVGLGWKGTPGRSDLN